MHSAIYFSIFFVLFTVSYGAKHRLKMWKPKRRCDQFDPPAVKNLNFDDIAGKWYPVRSKAQTTFKSDPTQNMAKAEWYCGSNKAKRSVRSLDDPNTCVDYVPEFVPVYGKHRSAFLFYVEELNTTIEWRALHFDKNYLVTWGCFARDCKHRCIDWGSNIFRRTPNTSISHKNLRLLDIIIKRATCDVTTKDFKKVMQTDC